MKRKTNKLSILLCLVYFAFSFFGFLPSGSFAKNVSNASSAQTSIETETESYYYDQLSETAKKIYRALEQMRDDGSFKTGTATIDLVELGYLSNKYYEKDELTSEFGAARDAFVLDNSDLFYVDFDKLSIRVLENGSKYKVTLGIGATDNYFSSGFNADNVESAISSFDESIAEIVEQVETATAEVDSSEEYLTKIQTAYKLVIQKASYALETTVTTSDNANYVRNAYGVLVAGEGCCEAFARAFKLVLDKLGVTSVLVQGIYVDVQNSNSKESHMWNYVFMDDGRWYLFDATMDNALSDNGESTSYFLKNNVDKITISGTEYTVAELYEANGIISSSNYEFTYPVLTSATYESYSSAFIYELSEDETHLNISYNGKGIQSTIDDLNCSIILTVDPNSESPTWYYAKQYIIILLNTMQNGKTFSDYDFETYFNASFINGTDCCFAITSDKFSGDEDAISTSTSFTSAQYTGENISEKSVVFNDTSVKIAPYATSVSPDSIRFYVGKSYDVTITYNEDLMKSNSSADVKLIMTFQGTDYYESETEYCSNFVWDENEPNKITFTFTPSKNYSADRCFYYFSVENLVGKSSKLEPSATGLYAMNKPSFSCPVDPYSYCTVYASQPQLLADSDLSLDDWTYANGESVSSTISAKLSLIATKYSETEESETATKIAEATGSTILSSSTYDLTLNLCDVQVQYLNNEKVKILVPFPDGYSASDTNVTFKAYHFNGDTIEEIDCTVCEYGIIMFCSSFSTYSVCALSGTSSTKTVAVLSEGNGSISSNATYSDYAKLEEGGSVTFTITPEANYCISSIKVGNSYVSFDDYTNCTLTFNYEDLSQDTIVVVEFASKSVVDAEIEAGYTLALSAPESSNSAWLVWLFVSLGIVAVAFAVGISVYVYKKRQSE